jgi:hypothetical protein
LIVTTALVRLKQIFSFLSYNMSTGSVVVEQNETLVTPTVHLEAEQQKEHPGEDLGFDPAKLRERYLQERDRRLKNGGINQYRLIEENSLSHFINDPYIESPITRDPIDEEVDVVIVGGGYGGQVMAVRLQQAGITNIKIIEKGGDFGGTWYVIRPHESHL